MYVLLGIKHIEDYPPEIVAKDLMKNFFIYNLFLYCSDPVYPVYLVIYFILFCFDPGYPGHPVVYFILLFVLILIILVIPVIPVILDVQCDKVY